MSLHRARFFASLARMTGSGMPVLRAGDVMESRFHGNESKEAVLALREGLARGESIADAMHPSLTELEYRMVSAAEGGGRLSDGFAHLERYHTLLGEARRRMTKAALYPLLILHMVALTTGVTAHLGGQSVVMALTISFGVLWGVLLAGTAGMKFLLAAAAKSELADRVMRRIPLTGRVWSFFSLTRWSAVMHFHILSGKNLRTALEAAGTASGSAGLSAASFRMADVAGDGRPLAEALLAERIFPDRFAAAIEAAEASGNLDTEMGMQTRLCMEEASLAVEFMAEWLPRILYIAALIIGALQVLRLAQSIFGVYQRVLDKGF